MRSAKGGSIVFRFCYKDKKIRLKTIQQIF